MRRITLIGAAVVLLVGLVVAPGAANSPAPSGAPAASPWGAQSVLIIQLHGTDGAALIPEQVTAAQAVVEERLAALGAAVTVTPIPDDRLRIELADSSQADAVKRVATSPGHLEFVPVPTEYANSMVEGGPLPEGMPVEPLVVGESIVTVSFGENSSGQPAIDVQLDTEAADTFDDWAAAHLGERFAIVLDDRVIAAPSINAARFDGRAQISGDFDLQQTRELIAILQGGTLPVAAAILDVCPAVGDCPAARPLPSRPPSG